MSKKQEILDISERYNISLSKKSGQCILIDNNIAHFIVDSANLDKKNDIIVEVGPGFGILTEKIVNKCHKLYIIEKDSRLVKYLKFKFENFKNIEIIEGDVLKLELPQHNKLISNLPYHISGPFLQKLISSNHRPETGILMLQDEFIQKMLSEPKPKNYGRSSVISSLFLDVKKIKHIPPTVFYPQPKVNSGIIKYITKSENILNLKSDKNMELFFEFLSGIFPYKNKTLLNSLRIFEKNIFSDNSSSSDDLKSCFMKKQDKFKNYIQVQSEELMKKRLWQCEPEEILKLFIEIFIE